MWYVNEIESAIFWEYFSGVAGYNLALWRLREAARNSKGMPIGVQVVTLPYEEEECLAVMEHIEALYNERLVPAVA